MSKKGKGVAFNSRVFNGVGMYEDDKARLKHQTLMQDFQDLQNEADVVRRKLEAAKQRKLTLAAEVRFLRRRYKYLSEAKTMSSPQKQILLHARFSATHVKEKPISRKEANHKLPLVPEPRLKKKNNIGKQIIDRPREKILQVGKETPKYRLTPVNDLNRKGRIHIKRQTLPPILDLNLNGRMNFGNARNSITGFDLNEDSNNPSGLEASLPNRAPIFDLNEVSTGNEDFQSNVEGLVRGVNDEQQNDLKLSICRNSGEGSSRVGKRKISWQDPVALRV